MLARSSSSARSLAAPRPRAGAAAGAAAGAGGAAARRRRSEPGAAGSVDGRLPRHQRAHAADGRPGRLRARPAVRADDVHAAEEPAGARVDARGLGADLRDLQDLPGHAGQVHPAARGVHRRDHGVLLRRARAASSRSRVVDHPALQPDRHRRQLRRRLVRHPRQHVRQLARGVRQPARQAVSDLRHPAARRHEHRHAADQRRAAPDALHPAVHPAATTPAPASSASPSASRSARRRCASPAASSPRSPTSAPT